MKAILIVNCTMTPQI